MFDDCRGSLELLTRGQGVCVQRSYLKKSIHAASRILRHLYSSVLDPDPYSGKRIRIRIRENGSGSKYFGTSTVSNPLLFIQFKLQLKKLLNFRQGQEKGWFRNRIRIWIRIKILGWIRIRTEKNTDPKHFVHFWPGLQTQLCSIKNKHLDKRLIFVFDYDQRQHRTLRGGGTRICLEILLLTKSSLKKNDRAKPGIRIHVILY